MRLGALIVVLPLAGALLVGCAGIFSPQVPDSDPSIRGVVTSVEPAGGTARSIRVVWTEAASVGAKAAYDAAQVAIVDETDVRRRVGGTDEPAAAAFKIGDVVEAWFTDGVRESYPVQATAAAIVITGTYVGEIPVPPGLEPEPAP